MSRSYSFMAKFIHWAFIGVFAIGVINQVDEVEELESTVLLVTEVVFAVVPSRYYFFDLSICARLKQPCRSSICPNL